MTNKSQTISPVVITNGDYPENLDCIERGLTKREYFAAMAMNGVCSSDNPITAKEVATWSVKMADELINELNKTP